MSSLSKVWGTATITAAKQSDEVYESTKTSYVLRVNRGEQTDFRFFQGFVLTRTFTGVGQQIILSTIGGESSGAISYSIDSTSFATIDSSSGVVTVTLKSTGTSIITATKQGDALYNPKKANLRLEIEKKKQEIGFFNFAKSSIVIDYTENGTVTNIASGGPGSGAVRYYVIGRTTNVATVNSAGVVTMKGIGRVQIGATKEPDDEYQAALANYWLTIRGRQTGFKFPQNSITISYGEGRTTSNIATGGQAGAITYSIDDTNVATVDNSGEVTLKGVGTATITATRQGNGIYYSTANSYVLIVTKGEQMGFGFPQSSITLTYEEDASTTNIATGGQSEGAITYSIDNTSVATINSSGQVKIEGVGSAIITAVKAGDNLYNSTADSYVLTVNRAEQTDNFQFAQTSLTTTYARGKVITNIATGGESSGVITYGSDEEKVARIVFDITRGEVIINGAGTATITATKAGDALYKPKTISYLLTVNKAQQTGFGFVSGLNIDYSMGRKIGNEPKGGQGTGLTSYEIDNTSVATIDPNNGELTLQGVGTATITATKAGDANYHQITASYPLTVNKGEQTDFGFAHPSTTTAYAPDKKISNRLVGVVSTGAASYSIDNTSIATVDSSGVVTIKGIGTATITVAKAGDANYKPTTKSYVLTVDRGVQTTFRFVQPSGISIGYNPDGVRIFANPTTGGESTGGVTYGIEDGTSVAEINPLSGTGTVKTAGIATITATKEGDSLYKPKTISYVLTVNKAVQRASLIFPSNIPRTRAYVADGIIEGIIATGGEESGTIIYSINNTRVATVDPTNGKVTMKGVGTARVTATNQGGINFKPISNSYVLTITKGTQTGFSFAQSLITTMYEENSTISNTAEGGQSSGAISYSIDNTNVATVDNNGEVTIKGVGTATVTATKAGDFNYNSATTNYELRVNKIEQNGFGFAHTSITTTYVADSHNKQYCRWR